jgi:predicted HicB family RNase H-like nuclease
MSDMQVDKKDGTRAASENFTIRLKPDVRKRLRTSAFHSDLSLNDFIAAMLDQHDATLSRRAAKQPSPLHRIPE